MEWKIAGRNRHKLNESKISKPNLACLFLYVPCPLDGIYNVHDIVFEAKIEDIDGMEHKNIGIDAIMYVYVYECRPLTMHVYIASFHTC